MCHHGVEYHHHLHRRRRQPTFFTQPPGYPPSGSVNNSDAGEGNTSGPRGRGRRLDDVSFCSYTVLPLDIIPPACKVRALRAFSSPGFPHAYLFIVLLIVHQTGNPAIAVNDLSCRAELHRPMGRRRRPAPPERNRHMHSRPLPRRDGTSAKPPQSWTKLIIFHTSKSFNKLRL